ncbi:MAG: winged helix-turn-helix transcriptional regulator [Fibrobacteres bacterium]|nr:winged helix-turn-helix transcriptional regulator [Fibrobacterota bacterium]
MDNRTVFELHAEICKTFAHPKRLEIINSLESSELSATQILDIVKISKANLSQHMGILVQFGVVESRKQGLQVFYKISDDRIITACRLMREVLISNIEKQSETLKSAI